MGKSLQSLLQHTNGRLHRLFNAAAGDIQATILVPNGRRVSVPSRLKRDVQDWREQRISTDDKEALALVSLTSILKRRK